MGSFRHRGFSSKTGANTIYSSGIGIMFQTVKPSCVRLFLLAYARCKRSVATETGKYTCQQLNPTKPSNPEKIVSDKAGLRRMRGNKSAVRANTCLKIPSVFLLLLGV